MKEKKIERTENDWVHIWVEKNVFNGFGGPKNLTELLEEFKKFAEGN